MAYASEGVEPEVKPDRLITMAVEYPGVQIARDEEQVSMDIIFHNKGKSDENVNLWIAEKPQGWMARIKTCRYAITGLHVPSGDDKTVTFEAEPDDGVSGFTGIIESFYIKEELGSLMIGVAVLGLIVPAITVLLLNPGRGDQFPR